MRDRSGERIDQYTLVQLIGQGGFGQVYKARKDGEQSFCALKMLIPNPKRLYSLQDFVLEIRTIYRLTHPNIIQMRDFGVTNLPGYADPLGFFVMDYCANGTLRKPGQQQLPLSTIVPYVKQIAAALQHVHDQEIVHRDVKPENLLIGDNNEVLLSDFGIATHSITGTSSPSGTLLPQLALGTLYYMAPEQMESKAVRASDQYALGVVVYEWLLGTVPFTGSTAQIIYQQKKVKPLSLLGLVADISPEVEAVVMRALEKDPGKRFSRVLDFSVALENAATIAQTIWQRPLDLTFSGHGEGVSAVAWSPKGQMIASGSGNGRVLLWEATTLRQQHRCDGHVGSVRSITWSHEGSQFATADENGTIFIWNAQNGQRIRQWQSQDGVRSIAWHPHKPYLISVGDEDVVRFWDTTTGMLIGTYQTQANTVDAVAWSPDGSLFACGCDDASVRVLEEATNRYRSLYLQHTDRVASIAWLPVGARQYVASAGYDCTIQIWDIDTQNLYSTYRDHNDAVLALAWSPTGRYLASGSCDCTVRIWEIATGNCVQQYRHNDEVSGVSWSPDGSYIASSSWDGTVQVHALDLS